jgi:hypothetical protein
MLDAGRVTLTLPSTLDRVLSKLETGQLAIRVGEDGMNGSSGGGGRRLRRAAAARQASRVAVPLLVCLGGLAAGVVLTLNQYPVPGWFCLGLGAVAALRLLLS